MKPTKLELLVGMFVVLGLAAVAWLTIKLGSGSLPSGNTYLIEARFTNASGLHSGGSVLLAGVNVGRVEEVRMDPADYSAVATLRVQSVVKLPTDSMASIKTSGLIGDKFIALSPGADDTYLEAGNRITMTESAVDLESLIGKIAFGSVDKKDDGSAAAPDSTAPPANITAPTQ
jgi:phospholipid/cholesterol/gamma-HCH transport system substrate-binding protein